MNETILVVDDAEDFLETCTLLLAHEGFRVVAATNGVDAMEQAAQVIPNLILMDLSLPVMDGLEATKRIKRDSRTQGIPVILLTANARGGPRAVIESGCEGFLVKPCPPRQLVEEIERVLKRSTKKA